MGLLLCAKCERHVHVSDSACPFCGATARLAATPGKSKPRASRSAMIGAAAIAMSCTSGSAIVGCGATTTGDDGGADSASDGLVAAYGGPFDASAIDAAKDAGIDSPVAAYGGPPQDASGGD